MFGCLSYAHNQKRNGANFASHSRKCVVIGYPYAKKGWTLFDLDAREVFVSCDVTFEENRFPYVENKNVPIAEDSDDENSTLILGDAIEFGCEEESSLMEAEIADREKIPSGVRVTKMLPENRTLMQTEVKDIDEAVVKEHVAENKIEPVVHERFGRGMHKKEQSVRLRDHILNTVQTYVYNIEDFVTCDRFSEQHRAFLAKITEDSVPQSFSEAMKHDKYWKAMRLEIDALEHSGTFSIELLPEGKT